MLRNKAVWYYLYVRQFTAMPGARYWKKGTLTKGGTDIGGTRAPAGAPSSLTYVKRGILKKAAAKKRPAIKKKTAAKKRPAPKKKKTSPAKKKKTTPKKKKGGPRSKGYMRRYGGPIATDWDNGAAAQSFYQAWIEAHPIESGQRMDALRTVPASRILPTVAQYVAMPSTQRRLYDVAGIDTRYGAAMELFNAQYPARPIVRGKGRPSPFTKGLAAEIAKSIVPTLTWPTTPGGSYVAPGFAGLPTGTVSPISLPPVTPTLGSDVAYVTARAGATEKINDANAEYQQKVQAARKRYEDALAEAQRERSGVVRAEQVKLSSAQAEAAQRQIAEAAKTQAARLQAQVDIAKAQAAAVAARTPPPVTPSLIPVVQPDPMATAPPLGVTM